MERILAVAAFWGLVGIAVHYAFKRKPASTDEKDEAGKVQ